MNNGFNFQSILADSITGFIAEKQAVGYKFKKSISILQKFDAYICTLPLKTEELTKDTVLQWTERSPYEKVSTQTGRISLMRGLAGYMNRIGKPAYIYPRGMVAVDRYSYTPYIFSEEEMRTIFSVCDQYPVVKESPNRHLVLALIIRMLYGCGLRVSEATNLTISDVDLKEGALYIRDTKFGKERLIPMANSLTKRCREYRELVLMGKSDKAYFFPSPLGGHYSSNTIYDLFRKIMWSAGISHTGKGPRLHDLRHTFAVHCLKKWVLKGSDLTNCLPYLSAYLGHEDMRGSQRYLRLTADLYPDITKKVEENCSWMMPEVTVDETD